MQKKISKVEHEIQKLYDEIEDTRKKFIRDYATGLEKKEITARRLRRSNDTSTKIDKAENALKRLYNKTKGKVQKTADRIAKKERTLNLLKN